MQLSKLQAMDPIAFEKYVGSLFARQGYRVEDTQASADEGIDLIVRQGRRMAVVQCKRYQGSVGQPVVRDLYGVMLHTKANEAYLVTTGSVTLAARRWAEGKPIHLVDQHRLVEWARTGRLNYEKPSALKPARRQLQFFVGLAVLVIVAIILVAPKQILAVRDSALHTLRPLLARIEGSTPPTTTPTLSPSNTPTPTAVPTISAPSSPPAAGPATPTPAAASIPTPGPIRPILTALPSPIRPGPTAILQFETPAAANE